MTCLFSWLWLFLWALTDLAPKSLCQDCLLSWVQCLHSCWVFLFRFFFFLYLKCNTFSFRQSPLSIICISIIWSLALQVPEAGIPFYLLQHTWYLSSLFFFSPLTFHFFFIFVPFLPTHCVVRSLTALHLDHHHSFQLMPLLSSSLCSTSTCICHQMSILKLPVIQESPVPPLINDQLFILPLKALTVWFVLPFQHSLHLFIFLNLSLWLHRFPTVFWICPVLIFTCFALFQNPARILLFILLKHTNS